MDNSLKDRVLESVDIVTLVGEGVSLTRRGKEYVGLCPFHDDHKPSLSVSPRKQIFKCFSCGAGGDAIRFVQLRERVGFPEALASLARRAGISVREPGAGSGAAQLREQLRQVLNWACAQFQRNLSGGAGRAARDYLRGRGFSEQTVARFGLGLARGGWDELLKAAGRVGMRAGLLHQAGLVTTNEKGRTYDRFRNRLMFPIRDGAGRLVAFGGRALGEEEPKYLNSPESPLFSKSRTLYGLDQARRAIEARAEAIVVEGYTDAALLHQHGFENVVATLGTALTAAHVRLLRGLAGSLVLCFDGDRAGTQAADRAVEAALLGRIDVRVLIMGSGQDPADCVTREGPQRFRSLLQSTQDALEFKWSLTVAGLGEADPRGRRAGLEEFVQFLARVSLAGGLDPLQEGLLTGRLSELLSLPPGTISELLAGAKRRVRRGASGVPAGAAGSAYVSSVRGLPAGLVAAVEELFGLVLGEARCLPAVDQVLEEAAGRCETWRRLHGVLRRLRAECGVFSRGDVLRRCEDAAICELVDRACGRVGSEVAVEQAGRAASARLRLELDTLCLAELQQRSRGRAGTDREGHQAYRDWLDVARRQQGVLAAASRWNARTTPGG